LRVAGEDEGEIENFVTSDNLKGRVRRFLSS